MTVTKNSKWLLAWSLVGMSLLTIAGYAFSADEASKNVYSEDKVNIAVEKKDPTFTIKLKSNPTTGFSWFLRDYDSDFIQPVSHSFHVAETKLLGAPGFETWVFKVKPAAFVVPQQTSLRFVYARPWKGAEDAKQLVFSVATVK